MLPIPRKDTDDKRRCIRSRFPFYSKKETSKDLLVIYFIFFFSLISISAFSGFTGSPTVKSGISLSGQNCFPRPVQNIVYGQIFVGDDAESTLCFPFFLRRDAGTDRTGIDGVRVRHERKSRHLRNRSD